MELRQLRSLIAICDNDFNVTRAAELLNIVQPAVSQQLKQLEEQLGAPLFVRRGKRLSALTPAGEKVLEYARVVLQAEANILSVGSEASRRGSGLLRIGATHTQARYVLPPVIRHFSRTYPEVDVQIHQGNPQQLVNMVLRDAVDISICTEALAQHPELDAIDSYRWNRCLIAPQGHPVFAGEVVTLADLCQFPLITYVFGFSGRGHLNQTFLEANLQPRIALSAADTDVIKTYVREGLGIGIIADLAYDEREDKDLQRCDLSHLFPWETTKIAFHRNKYLKQHEQRFIDIFQEEALSIANQP